MYLSPEENLPTIGSSVGLKTLLCTNKNDADKLDRDSSSLKKRGLRMVELREFSAFPPPAARLGMTVRGKRTSSVA